MPFRGGADSVESSLLHLRRMDVLFDHLPALIGYWDRDLRNVMANAAYIEWFGFTPQQMRGMHIRDVLGPETYAKNLPFITGALAGEEQLFERTLIDTSGHVRHTQASYVPDLIDGKNYGFFVLVTDVTARVEAQRALDEAQRLAELGSWSLEVDSETLTWSQELYRIFGLDPDEFVPGIEAIAERIDPADLERVERQLAHARSTGEDYDLVYRIRRADGQTREIHSRGHAHTKPDGTVVRLTGTLQDVTVANAAARDLARANAQLTNVNQLNADVLAMIGHDVRAPLAVILGYLEVLDEAGDVVPPQYREFISRAFSASLELSTLVEDILAMARVDSGQIVAHPAEVSVSMLTEQVLDGIKDGDTVATSTRGDLRAHVDPFHLRQILSNLVTNALRYGQPPVAVHAEPLDGHQVRITVSDHGPGVPDSKVATLFDRFVSGGSASAGSVDHVSTGFGLYLASGLAEANGASLQYEPSGPGATFTLTLPGCPSIDE